MARAVVSLRLPRAPVREAPAPARAAAVKGTRRGGPGGERHDRTIPGPGASAPAGEPRSPTAALSPLDQGLPRTGCSSARRRAGRASPGHGLGGCTRCRRCGGADPRGGDRRRGRRWQLARRLAVVVWRGSGAPRSRADARRTASRCASDRGNLVRRARRLFGTRKTLACGPAEHEAARAHRRPRGAIARRLASVAAGVLLGATA